LHKVRTTDGYRLISRRSPDRNWLLVFHPSPLYRSGHTHSRSHLSSWRHYI
jgi:hypothetical protein